MNHPRRAHCVQCHTEIDPHKDSGHYQQVVGFVKLRARGANEVKLRRPRSIFICKGCMDLLTSGMVPGQGDLFRVEIEP
jgi:hypothetical protein